MAVENFTISNTKVKLRYREPYVTDSNNEKALAFPRGCYRGYLPRKSTVADMSIWLAIDPLSIGNDEDSFAIYADRDDASNDGWALSIRETTDVELDLSGSAFDPIPGGVTYLYVYIVADYQPGYDTTCTYRVSNEDPYNVASSNYDLNVVLIGRVPVTPSASTIDFDITNTSIYNDVVSVRKVPSPTSKQAETSLAAGEERWGYFDSVSKWRTPTEDEKLAMTNSSSPGASNPFVTDVNVWDHQEFVIDSVSRADYQSMVSTGLFDSPWALANDTENVISGGSTKEYRDLGVFFSSDNTPRLLVLDNANCKIEVWNARTRALVITTNALSDDLPSGGGQTWEPFSMCTDGTNVYVMLVDTNASPDTYQIQAWVISESSSNWSVKSGWSSTGTALPGSGTPIMTRPGRVIIASSTKLATSNGWVTISASTSDAVSIISIADGSIDDSAAGDAPTGISAHPELGICSDGTNVFFTVRQPSGSFPRYICSATIANPQVGCGGTGYPFYCANFSVYDMCSCGPNMMVSLITETSGTATGVVLRTNNSSNAILDIVERGQNSAATPLSGTVWHMFKPYAVCFDGMHVWILAIINLANPQAHAALVKIDAAKLSLLGVTSNRQLTDISETFIISPDTSWSGYNIHKIAFDGRDLWVNLDPRASQTNSGKIVRLPFALMRG